MNISSIIIKVSSHQWENTYQALSQIPKFEIALVDKQKQTMIGVIEAEDSETELSIFGQVSSTEGVIEANMHLSYTQTDLKQMTINELAELIDSTPIEKISYGGNVETLLKK